VRTIWKTSNSASMMHELNTASGANRTTMAMHNNVTQTISATHKVNMFNFRSNRAFRAARTEIASEVVTGSG